ncbi:UdgX family uracil-DNA binding protein [Labrys okinawensis]|uniref:UdgX family uracil-DNA binding protein n=1 Tax=Labrys okinawensis TaxID=346911 RepID=UPI0039BC5504
MTRRFVVLKDGADLAGFRRAVRSLVAADIAPGQVSWSTGAMGADLFGAAEGEQGPPVALPRALGEWIDTALCHRDPERHALLYTLIWRVLHGERALLDIPSDPLVHRLARLNKAVGRDIHKMHAFLRFRRIEEPAGSERFAAWFEPEHYILEAVSGFFVDRFRSLTWSILTPIGSLHWDREHLVVGPPGRREDVPADDPFEKGWRGYYESTFNPARVNPELMRSEMPKKYWRNLPEAQAIPELIRLAPTRVMEMLEREAAMPIKRNPDKAVAAMAGQEPHSLEELNRIIAASEPLVPGATQAVLGEGPVGAGIAFVGEQPGDQEDLQGRPFVGPAGQLLDRALNEAGIDRREAYLTNAVKHFKYELLGKKRLHRSPTAGEIKHYRWWLDKELDFVRPRLTVALGASAVQALAGKALPIGRNRGPIQFGQRAGFITVHPSYLLRLPDAGAKEAAYGDFVRDLRAAKALADGAAA